MARTDPEDKGAGGISAFIVEREHAGHHARQARPQDGPARRPHLRRDLRELPRAGGQPDRRRRGPRLQDRDEGARQGPHPHRRRLRRRGRAHARATRCATRWSASSSASRSPSSSSCRRCWPTARPRSTPRAAWCSTRRAGATTAADVTHRGLLLQAVRLRDVRPRGRPRGADPRRRRLHRRLRHRALLPRRAPVPHLRRHHARSSSSSSPATWCAKRWAESSFSTLPEETRP